MIGAGLWRVGVGVVGLGLVPLGLVGCKAKVIEIADSSPSASTTTPSDAAAGDPLLAQAVVRAAVERYAAALDARDPAAAAAAVVPETFELYEDLRLAALQSSRAQLESWGLLTVVMILQIRATTSRERLASLDGRGLFERAVVAGMAAEELVLDDVWIDASGEVAEIRIDGQPVLWLRPVDRDWRVDLPRMITEFDDDYEALAREQVRADGRVLTAYTLVEVGSDEPIAFEIVDGPLDAAALGDDVGDSVAPQSQP